RHLAARARLLPSHLRRLDGRGRAQRRVRAGGGVGPRALSLPGAADRGRARRPALRAADRGGGHRPHVALLAERLAGRAPREAGAEGRLRAAGHRRRAHVHRAAVRGAHAAARDRGPRRRGGGGGGQPRRRPEADLRARDPARSLSGLAHRLRARVRARAGRVRLGRLHRREHADAHRDHVASHHHQAGAVRLRGRHRHGGRDAGGVVPAAGGHQPPAVVGQPPRGAGVRRALTEPPVVRAALLAVAVVFLAAFLVLPLVAVFAQALEKGFAAYVAALREPDAWAAIRLTLLTAAVAVPLNLVFGLAASWAIAKFEFPGKGTLLTLIDLPFAVSPVISGMIFVLLFGRQGLL